MFTYLRFIAPNWCYPHAALSVAPHLIWMAAPGCLFLGKSVKIQLNFTEIQAQVVSVSRPVTMYVHSVPLQSLASVYNKDCVCSGRFTITKEQTIPECEYFFFHQMDASQYLVQYTAIFFRCKPGEIHSLKISNERENANFHGGKQSKSRHIWYAGPAQA